MAISFDGNTTYKSALQKLMKQFDSQTKSSTPLKDFYEYKWQQTDLNFGQYVIKLQSLLTFVENKGAQEQIVIQHCIEQFRAEFRILLKNKNLRELVESVSELNKYEIISSVVSASLPTNQNSQKQVVCFNCSKNGHIASHCFATKWKCKICNRYGHKENFCRNNSKNVEATNLSVD